MISGGELGKRVAYLRKSTGLSLDEVARRSGLSKTHVWELEKGRSKNPSVKTCKALSRAFGCSVGDFINDSLPHPHEIAIMVGADAMRLALGMRPTMPPREILEFLRAQADAQRKQESNE